MPRVTAFVLSACHAPDLNDPHLSSEALKRAKELGFEAVIWPVAARIEDELPNLRALAERCGSTKLRLILAIDPARFPIDDPAVSANPDVFALRRTAPRDAPVDPRKPLPATGEALARVRSGEAASALAEVLEQRFRTLVGSGAGGVHLIGAERMAPALLHCLLDRLRAMNPDLTLIAGPLSVEPSSASEFEQAGFDFLVSPCPERMSGEFIERLDALRASAPVLMEIENVRDAGARVDIAAALGGGAIMPARSLADPQLGAAMARVRQIATKAAEFTGEIRLVSTAAAPVAAVLRGEGLDLRMSREALLVLVNQSSQPQPVPTQTALSLAGAAFGEWIPCAEESDALPLAPVEVRMFAGARRTPVRGPASASEGPTAAAPRLVVEDLSPCVEGGDFPVKRVVGDVVRVEATVFADGHEQLAAELRWRPVDSSDWSRTRMTQLPNDRWQAEFPLERLGRHEFQVEGWLDRFGGFRRDFATKRAAGVAQPVDAADGRVLVARATERCKGKVRTALKRWLERLDKADGEQLAKLLLDDELAALMAEVDDRPQRRLSERRLVDAERIEARFSSWYELFPRSQTDDPERHGTFADVIERLPAIRAMGFDTLYFPPIHPIGRTNRKGPNNTLTPGPDDPGSPYAIGSSEGGHDAIHPQLGTFADFGRLVAAAHEHGLEIALDFAIQCSPDHPWLKEHPGWFDWRPDGSLKYAENPPKKYQDIVNVDFYGPDAIPSLWHALRDVVLLWIDHGVKVFRVDNPHTKPLPFWQWLIGEVRAEHPEVIFLSEAFTRPTMMYRLAKIGFSQSYTYFTWRDGKQELIDYFTELTTEAPREFYRPHLFVNTPDINPFYLQTSGRPGFRIRAVLAATLSGLWGVYSGFELCEFEPLGSGKEEYLDSEKFEIRVRDWNQPGNIIADIALLNRLRRTHPALQTHLETRFYLAHDPNVIWYGKPSPGGGEMIMVMVNLDPHHPHECDFEVPLWEFGLPDQASVAVEDLAAGHRFDWHGKVQHIRLAPDEPYRIWRLTPPGDAA